MAIAKEAKENVVWDKKKIAIFLISLALFIILVFELRTLILGKQETPSKPQIKNEKQIQGASVENLPSIRQGIQTQIDNLKKEAESINVMDVATSSPQVQKVINDLKSLQNLPQSQFKQACEKVCNGL